MPLTRRKAARWRQGGALTAADIHDQMFLKVQRYIEHSRASIVEE
jgi:hypothetical protein